MSLEADLKDVKVNALEISSTYLLVEKGTSVRTTIERMRDEKTSCSLITEEKTLIGIFTDQDVIDKILGCPDTWDRPVEDFMTPAPGTVRPDASAVDAIKMMDEAQFRNLPVVDAGGVVVGNVNQQSIIRFLSDRYHMHVYNQPPEPERYVRARHGA